MPKDHNKLPALVVASVAAFLTPFMGSSVNIALPAIGREFAMDAVLLSWVSTAFLLAAAMFLVPFGRLADIYGRKKIFGHGVAIYTVSSLLAAVAISDAVLIAARILQGFGSAMIFGTGIAILTSVHPPGERGKALGINVAAVYLGLSLGPFFGGVLTQHLGWRSIFFVNLPMGVLLLVLVRKLRGEWAEAKGEKFDRIGASIYAVALTALMLGFSLLPAKPGAWLIVLGLVGILVFVRWERQTPSPVLRMHLFNNAVFAFSNLAALIHYSATFALNFLLSLYLQYVKGLAPQTAGIILVSQPLVMTIFSPFAGWLSDRIEPRVVASIGMALSAVGLFLFTFLREESALPSIIAGLMMLGLGFALFSSPNTNAVMSAVEKRFYGLASGTLGTMRLTGQMLSMGIATLIFAVYLGRVQITPAHYPLFMKSIRSAFMIFAGLCFAGTFASLARGKVTPVRCDDGNILHPDNS
ncbi:MAG: MFS transporter [candidate division KSB1 bacterium]|nr:MFS transporter [candidate division KSB1 bacterium]MDZ7304568.1 MFS transporter [candidate division KSB1 bacterium]MDZ7313637.1 MFS transporter [candidate division KSB1 bacterium]